MNMKKNGQNWKYICYLWTKIKKNTFRANSKWAGVQNFDLDISTFIFQAYFEKNNFDVKSNNIILYPVCVCVCVCLGGGVAVYNSLSKQIGTVVWAFEVFPWLLWPLGPSYPCKLNIPLFCLWFRKKDKYMYVYFEREYANVMCSFEYPVLKQSSHIFYKCLYKKN